MVSEGGRFVLSDEMMFQRQQINLREQASKDGFIPFIIIIIICECPFTFQFWLCYVVFLFYLLFWKAFAVSDLDLRVCDLTQVRWPSIVFGFSFNYKLLY